MKKRGDTTSLFCRFVLSFQLFTKSLMCNSPSPLALSYPTYLIDCAVCLSTCTRTVSTTSRYPHFPTLIGPFSLHC